MRSKIQYIGNYINNSLSAKIVISIVYTLFAAEMFLRMFAPIPMLPRYIKATSFGIRGNMGNQSYWHKTPDYAVHIRTNSRGIRSDREIPYEKPANEKRIVILGDSFGMGYGVNLEDSFLSKMKHRLGAAGKNVQVINLSVSGHGNAEELLMLENEGLRYNPDLVLLCWHRTDLLDNIRSGLFTLKEGTLVQKSKTYLPGVKVREYLFSFSLYRWMAGNSHLYNWLRDRAARTVKKLLVTFKTTGKKTPAGQTTEKGNTLPQDMTLALLHKIQIKARQHKAEFLIFDIPEHEGRRKYWSALPHNNRYRFHIISPEDAFNKRKGELLYWERSHGHFTPQGCDIAGNMLAEYILQHRLLK